MNLYKKILLAFVGVAALFALGSYAALSRTLIPAFDELEERAAAQDMSRVRNGLLSFGRVLSYTTLDWGQWDETYSFLKGENPDFEEENLEAASLIALDINILIMYDRSGSPFWEMYVASGSNDGQKLPEAFIDDETAASLNRFPTLDAETRGLIRTADGTMIVSARPITRSDVSGPAVGAIVVGRLLDNSKMDVLRETVKVTLDLSTPSSEDYAALKPASPEYFGQTEQFIGDEARVTRQILHDIHGEPATVLAVQSPRSITGLRQDTVTSLILLFVGLGSLIVFFLWYLLSALVVRPISTLRREMVRIEADGDLSDRVNMQRSDEIGDLSHAFDSMLQELEDARSRHIEQSFKAGMAEVAAGVLHNVRNSLMPILNNVVMAEQSAASMSNDNLGKAIDELVNGDVAQPRREKLWQYLTMSRKRIDEERAGIVSGLGDATSQLNHVVAILRDQERYTHNEPVLEMVNIAELVSEASSIIPANDDIDIKVEQAEVAPDCNVRAHRIGLLQVLNNILLNAYESIVRTNDDHGQISIVAKVDNDCDDPLVHITIKDTGVGIEADEIAHVFDRGFSSKNAGSGGLGLHWSANAIASMGGNIAVSSDGTGHGASFHVTLDASQRIQP